MTAWNEKIALVTGAGSGVGRATALRLARLGARVVATDINSNGLAETVRLAAAGGGIEPRHCDVSDRASVEALFAGLPRIDIAANVAGIGQSFRPLEQLDAAEVLRITNINYLGLLWCLQHEIRLMRGQGGGAIVNVASDSGLQGQGNLTAYAASKHAAVGLTRSSAIETAAAGIRINAVCPGPIDTPMLDKLKADVGAESGFTEQLMQAVPMGRCARADEIAEAVIWLASDAASYVTGVALPVDGGMFAM